MAVSLGDERYKNMIYIDQLIEKYHGERKFLNDIRDAVVGQSALEKKMAAHWMVYTNSDLKFHSAVKEIVGADTFFVLTDEVKNEELIRFKIK
jgi:hypothetical protein